MPLVFWFASETPAQQFKFIELHAWIPSIGAQYHLGIDGISFLLIMLTTVLGFIAVLSSWTAIQERVTEYYAMFLLLQVGMLGVFMSLDFFLFYVFWEVMLVPMYFIIGVWGGPRKLYAAIKFFLYTLAGSVLMLLGILTLYLNYTLPDGRHTFDLTELMKHSHSWPLQMQIWVFAAFAIGFAIKVPMFPFHTWLPDAHVEAPTAGSVILAGVLLKMGTYGFIRFSLPLLPDASSNPTRGEGDGVAFAHRHRLRGAGLPDAEGHEEADCLFLGEPPGILHAGNFRLESARLAGKRDSADQPRHFHRSALLDCRADLRAPPHARDQGIWRAFQCHAHLRDALHDRDALLDRPAASEWLYRRVHDSARRIRSELALGRMGRVGNRPGRCLHALALPADDVWPLRESQEPGPEGFELPGNHDAGSFDHLGILDWRLPQALF